MIVTKEILTRAATLGPRTFNAAERTVEAVFASGNIVNGIQLALMPENVASAVGVPVMNAHDRSSIDKILGVVTEAWIVGNEARARIKFSERANPYLPDIEAGIITGVSVGFNMIATSDRMEGKKRVMVADKWAAREISLVPVGQDPAGRIRSEETNMAKQRTVAETEDDRQEIQTEQPVTPVVEEQAPIVNRAAINQEIRSTGELVGLGPAWANPLIDAGATVEQARQAAFDALKTRSPNIRVVQTPTMDDPAFRSRAIGEALATRLTSQAPPEQARDFVGLTSVELCRELLRTSGLSTMGSPGVVVERAMTTSDLPALMGDAINRSMRLAYQAVPSALKLVARQRTASDFRTLHRIQLSAAPTLEKVNESGEFVHGAVTDSEETYKLETFGRIVSLSRQVLINDDLGSLADLTRRMGIAAAAFEAQSLVDMLESPPVMADGFAVFSTNHSNLASPTGAAPSDTTLNVARLALRKQTDPSGMLIAATPKYLLVPPDLETAAQKFLTSIQAVEVANVNPWSFLTLIVEPRLTDTYAWYLIADPVSIDGLEFAYLSGEEGPQTFSEVGFDVDGIKYKIREDFGCGWVEPRGYFKNPGH